MSYYDEFTEEIRLISFVMRGVVLIALGAIGVLGNALTVAALSRRQMRSSINCLLLGLAVCDSVLNIMYVLLFGFKEVCLYTNRLCKDDYIWPHVFPYMTPIAFAAQTMSVYLTLAVSVERWVAVCYPFRTKTLCTVSRARWCVLVTATFALLYNAPRFLEAYVVESKNDAGETIYVTAFDLNYVTDTYVLVYEHCMYLVVMFIVPLTALVVLNACIVRQLRRAMAERALLSHVQRQELGVTRMLLVMVLVFFLCNLLPLTVNLIEVIIFFRHELQLDIDMTNLFNVLILVHTTSILLVMTYSSVNFFIYFIFGANFKKVFLKMFCDGGIVCSTCFWSENKKAVKANAAKAQGQTTTTSTSTYNIEELSVVTKL